MKKRYLIFFISSVLLLIYSGIGYYIAHNTLKIDSSCGLHEGSTPNSWSTKKDYYEYKIIEKRELRKNFASVGYTYDEVKDAFIPPQKYKSWTLDEESCKWKPPVEHPLDGKSYTWNEQNLTWDEVE